MTKEKSNRLRRKKGMLIKKGLGHNSRTARAAKLFPLGCRRLK
jgi:hypothetical protein